MLTKVAACLIFSTIPLCPRYCRESHRGSARSFSTGWLEVRPAARDWAVQHTDTKQKSQHQKEWPEPATTKNRAYQGWVFMSVQGDSGYCRQSKPLTRCQGHAVTSGGCLWGNNNVHRYTLITAQHNFYCLFDFYSHVLRESLAGLQPSDPVLHCQHGGGNDSVWPCRVMSSLLHPASLALYSITQCHMDVSLSIRN